ncbi:LytR/AlgR family response regulator transcription factor [Clostridium sp. UBA1652]|uniref:LytR/AlgR family response regulator transcription factor n=1 Tax=Clostridium sp. UBA1652 TaxID=1946348 RepID=UPI00257D4D18|nr:LytTR family DNA-binding domain-containing protein [Clostridium sp. UBA1652]
MIRVFICEDNEIQRKRYKKVVENTIDIENLDMQLVIDTEKPEEIIEYVKTNKGIGLYFLDIELEGQKMDGIKLAAEIRKYDPLGFIVFITSHVEMSHLAFKYRIEAMEYIEKYKFDEIKERIAECILDANNRYTSSKSEIKIFNLKIEGKIIAIEQDRILFFETLSGKHKILLHGIGRQLTFSGNLNDIEKELDDNFYRCHKSYIVNKNNIRKIDTKNKIIHMLNGEECMVSYRKIKGLVVK